MIDHTEGRAPDTSRLPNDPMYWEQLADRVTSASKPHLEHGQRPWWRALAAPSRALAACAAAAALAAWTLLPDHATAGSDVPFPSVTEVLIPDEQLGRTLLSGQEPPPMASLLRHARARTP